LLFSGQIFSAPSKMPSRTPMSLAVTRVQQLSLHYWHSCEVDQLGSVLHFKLLLVYRKPFQAVSTVCCFGYKV